MPTLELGRCEIIKEMDRITHARLALSASEVVRRYRAGELEDPGQVGDVLVLSDLLSPDDPFFEE